MAFNAGVMVDEVSTVKEFLVGFWRLFSCIDCLESMTSMMEVGDRASCFVIFSSVGVRVGRFSIVGAILFSYIKHKTKIF